MSLTSTESLFCTSLIAVLQYAQTSSEVLQQSAQELAALRETLDALDPTFHDVLVAKRAEVAALIRRKASPIGISASDLMPHIFEKLIRQLKELQDE